jgi:hypothetical protein
MKQKKIMKKLYLAIICVFVSGLIYGQDPQVTYKVTNYSLNGENYDFVALEGDVALSFYYCDENTICFANHWRGTGSQSYGPVYALKHREFSETRDTYKAVEIKFTWQYFNTYDSKTGQAAVTITNIYIGNTIKFTADIVVLDTNEVIELKGYLE